MKHSILIFGLALSFIFSACQKEYQCVCTNTSTGQVSYGDKFKTNVFTKKTWEENCKNNGNLSGGTLKDCHLE
jgi:hypothetical protein